MQSLWETKMTFQPDLELREKVFGKMGWELRVQEEVENDDGIHKKHVWWNPITGNHNFALWYEVENASEHLPPVEISWEVCAEYLVAFMRDQNCEWAVSQNPMSIGKDFVWYGCQHGDKGEEIKDDNIALAACKAFMEVEL